jgi:hypothetical protein
MSGIVHAKLSGDGMSRLARFRKSYSGGHNSWEVELRILLAFAPYQLLEAALITR